MKKTVILNLLLFIGLGGSLLFFPLKIADRYTCIFHFGSAPSGVPPLTAEPNGSAAEKNSGYTGVNPSDGMLDFYIRHFSWLWWGSIGLAVFSAIYLINRSKKKELLKHEKPSGGLV